MSSGRFSNPLSAALTGFFDRFRSDPLRSRFNESVRFDDKRVLITGANSGLGYAVTKEIVRRGGHVTMACRSGIPEAGDRIRRDTTAGTVEMRRCDLSDLSSVHEFVEGLAASRQSFDVVVLNAAVTLPSAQRTPCGQDQMFQVNFLANVMLVNLLLERKLIGKDGREARLIVISSDSHRGASAVDYAEFGQFFDYGVNKAISNYSYFKLLLNTWATELGRKIAATEGMNITVNLICPGPVNTNIIKAAPWPLRMLLRGIFTIIFQTPERAAEPVVYLCGSSDFAGRSNVYLHMFAEKEMDPKVYDMEEGKKLWTASASLWQKIDPGAHLYRRFSV